VKDIIDILNQKYVDSLNGDSIFESAISDMLHKLDPHSNYIPASELKAATEMIEGKFGGVGVRFVIIRDTICVTHVISNSPSARAGVMPGDRIIEINKKSVANKKITNEKVMKSLKGEENTAVNVTIYRGKKKIKKEDQEIFKFLEKINLRILVQ
jgi:carboxyl-terminal processing protease